jgi:hypothetical protein
MSRLRAQHRRSLFRLMRFRDMLRAGVVTALVLAQVAAMRTAPMCECDGAEMPGMPMPATHHTPSHPGTPHRSPCSHPMAPGECGLMIGCTSGPMLAVRPATPVTVRVAAPACAVIAEAPRSVTRAPEPPPPRI